MAPVEIDKDLTGISVQLKQHATTMDTLVTEPPLALGPSVWESSG